MGFHKLKIDASRQPLFLSPYEGRYIRSLIFQYTGLSQNEFSLKIGMDRALLSRYLSGKKAITDAALTKILNGINFTQNDVSYTYEAKWEIHILIHPCKTGQTAQSVDSMMADDP